MGDLHIHFQGSNPARWPTGACSGGIFRNGGCDRKWQPLSSQKHVHGILPVNQSLAARLVSMNKGTPEGHARTILDTSIHRLKGDGTETWRPSADPAARSEESGRDGKAREKV